MISITIRVLLAESLFYLMENELLAAMHSRTTGGLRL